MKKNREISHFISECEHPLEEIKSFAHAQKIPLADLDFEIVGYRTFYSTDKGAKKTELQPQDRHKLDEESFLSDPAITLYQTYSIIITGIKELDNFKPSLSVVANKTISRVIGLFKTDSRIMKDAMLHKRLLDFLNNKKIRHGLMLGLHEELFIKEIDRFIQHLPDSGRLSEEYQLILCQSGSSKPSQNAEFLPLYQQKSKQEDRYGRIDHSERGVVVGVQADETIAEFLKPVTGEPGRNCKGEFFTPPPPQGVNQPPYRAGEGVAAHEEESKIVYKALKNGFVQTHNGFLSIEDQISFGTVNFKDTGALRAGVDSGTVLNITEQSSLGDSIGIGMEIEVTEINAHGNAGSGSKIHAKKVTIGGQTHQSSHIESDEAIIEIHKGTLRAKTARINRLENGVIEADRATIFHAIGGSIKARDVYIENLHSNARIEASELIEINMLHGEDNKLAIHPEANPETREEIADLIQFDQAEVTQLNRLQREINQLKKELQHALPAIRSIQTQIKEIKRSGEQPPSILLKKIKEFQHSKKQLEALQHKKETLLNDSAQMHEKLESYRQQTLSAKVINHSGWHGYNEVRFRLLRSPKDFLFIPRKAETILMLKPVRDGEWEITETKE